MSESDQKQTDHQTTARRTRVILSLMALVLLVPILPFLLFGSQIEGYFQAWVDHPPETWLIGMTIFLLLTSDILLPVPSSLVSTLAGSQLGFFAGTLISFTGLSCGAMLGFALARNGGPWLVKIFGSNQEIETLRPWCDKYGPLVLVVTRALPILAEATVLFFGLSQLSWRKFLWPTLLANLGISLGYSLFGEIAAKQEWLLIASAISIALPFGLALFVRRLLYKQISTSEK